MCPYCGASGSRIIKKGLAAPTMARRRAPPAQRYLCKACRRRFSERCRSLTFREKRPAVTRKVLMLLCSGVSQRRTAEILKIHRETVARKLVRLGSWTEGRTLRRLQKAPVGPIVVFDEMETYEHTKCKPLSIATAVEQGSRRLIAARVARMPAKGLLAKISRKKYGPRPDGRPIALEAMVQTVKKACPVVTELRSDLCPRYPPLVRRHFPEALHLRFKGRRGCIVGQGELKRGGFDPLFSLNHTCAMARDNLKRLSRRTWCSTKRPDRLQAILNLYIWFHNERLVGKMAPDVRP